MSQKKCVNSHYDISKRFAFAVSAFARSDILREYVEEFGEWGCKTVFYSLDEETLYALDSRMCAFDPHWGDNGSF